MATETTIQRPAPFVEKLGTNLAENVLAQQGVPLVAPGAGGITQLAGEDPDLFAARQKAAQAFDVRKQSIAGLAPQVADQDALQTRAQTLASDAAGTSGIGSFEPFLNQAQTQAQLAQGLGTQAFGQFGIAGTELTGAGTTLGQAGTELTGAGATFGGVPIGPATSAQMSQYMSPYQSQVIDASLAEFDRNKSIRKPQTLSLIHI